jgi:hypothetical protein
MERLTIKDELYYFDPNSRVYEIDGVRQITPSYSGHYRKIQITGEDDKFLITSSGKINKINRMYLRPRWDKVKVLTKEEMLDDVYVQTHRHILAEKVRQLDADVLRKIEAVLKENSTN